MSAQTAFLLFLGIVVLVVLVTRLRPAARGSDLALTAAVNAALAKEFPFSNIQIDVKTFDGVVILGGFTHEYGQTQRAVEIAQATQGVKSVESRLSVRSA